MPIHRTQPDPRVRHWGSWGRAAGQRWGGVWVGVGRRPQAGPAGEGLALRASSAGLRGVAVRARVAGGPGRRRRLREEHESAAAATAATAVEGAPWPRSGPGDPALLTAAGATRSGRGPRRRPPQRRPQAGPRPSRRPPLLPPGRSLAGRARHGAASPPMALRRSMGRSGLPPLPLLAGLATLLLPEPAAAGRG